MTEPTNPANKNPYLPPSDTGKPVAAASRRKRSSSFIALALVNGLSLLVTGFLMAFVAPSFLRMFEEFGIELPMITQLIFRVSQFWPVAVFVLLLASIASLVVHWFLWKKKPSLAAIWFFIISTAWAVWFVVLFLSFWVPMDAIEQGIAA